MDMNIFAAPSRQNRYRFPALRLTLLALLLLLSACARVNTAPSATLTATNESTPITVDSSPTATLTLSSSTVTSSSPSPTSAPTQTLLPTAMPDCLFQGGQVLPKDIPSTHMNGELKFHLYLPPCYEQDTARHYPVLYLIHGQSFNDDQWVRLGATKAADELIAAGMPPFIIVMPFDKYHYRQPATDPFDEAVIEELIPYIDSTYRTLPERTSRAVGGLSRGGGWALHFALNYPDLFGTLGGHSMAILDEDGRRISRLLDSIPVEDMPRIYMDIGKSDGLKASAEKFEAQLSERGILHEWYVYPGFHNEAYWSKHVKEYIKWYATGWVGQ
jgi:enterochelin esterase-like enzyme